MVDSGQCLTCSEEGSEDVVVGGQTGSYENQQSRDINVGHTFIDRFSLFEAHFVKQWL